MRSGRRRTLSRKNPFSSVEWFFVPRLGLKKEASYQFEYRKITTRTTVRQHPCVPCMVVRLFSPVSHLLNK